MGWKNYALIAHSILSQIVQHENRTADLTTTFLLALYILLQNTPFEDFQFSLPVNALEVLYNFLLTIRLLSVRHTQR